MANNLKEAIMNRRTYYSISDKSPVSNETIVDTVRLVVKHVPSAFNSQSARLVVLFGENHKKFWNIVKETLRKYTPENKFAATEAKIDGAFAAGYGTILFFEDQSVVKNLQNSFALYSEKFPVWSQHTSAMHQYLTWVLLEDAGLGASLQHYNPIIDEEVLKTWNLDSNWSLVAQMPFGLPTEKPGEKEYSDLDKRIKVFY